MAESKLTVYLDGASNRCAECPFNPMRGDVDNLYTEEDGQPIEEQPKSHRFLAWWDNMKPDWGSIKKICPNIPTSWYVYENVTG